MAYSGKKRFVAGAVCPRCQALDKLMVYSKDGKDFRECVECDYHEEMRFSSVARELETRVNQNESNQVNEIQVVTILSSTKH